jgi:hypothetical protein
MDAVAIAARPASGSHGALDRHAVMFDLASSTSKKNKAIKNTRIPTHIDPIWSFHPGSLLI